MRDNRKRERKRERKERRRINKGMRKLNGGFGMACRCVSTKNVHIHRKGNQCIIPGNSILKESARQ